MERTFQVAIDKTRYVTETYRVEAESFDEAEEKVRDGYGELYEDDEYDWEWGDVQEIECRECGADTEEDCSCDGPTLADETNNPDYATGTHPKDLAEDDWITPDEYTKRRIYESIAWPARVTEDVDEDPDSDGDWAVHVEGADGVPEYFYARNDYRFLVSAGPSEEEQEAAREAAAAAKAAADQARRESNAVRELLRL